MDITPKTPEHSEEMNAIVTEYIYDGTNTKEYSHKSGLSVTFRVPTQGQLVQHARQIDKEMFATQSDGDAEVMLSVDSANLIRNNNLLALYVSKVNDRNFYADQGSEYATIKGMIERREYLLGEDINVYMFEWMLKKLTEFQTMLRESFEEEHLKNM